MPRLPVPVPRGRPSAPAPALSRLLGAPRDLLAARVGAGFRAIVSGDPTGAPPWVRDLAAGDDVGYFGPGSAVWAVHSDLATLVGGIRALILQSAHPATLAGVDQHSTYREDPLGRLAGTTRWLTVTAFGSRAAADREAARVRGLHRKVRGTWTDAEGRDHPYRADDQRLLGWVHATFTDAFLTAHTTFGGPLPGGPDGYVGEWATAGRLVGLTDPPRTVRELRDAIAGYGPELARTATTDRTLAFLRNPPLPAPARVGYAVLHAAAVSTLDPEHRRLLGLHDPGRRIPQAAAGALLATLRTVLGSGPPAAAAARRRTSRLGTGTGRDTTAVAPTDPGPASGSGTGSPVAGEAAC